MSEKLQTVVIEKLVHGGQGLGLLPDGRKIFVWNALPAEKLGVRITKEKRSYAEGIAETVIKASPQRIAPEEDIYLSTSPWQMMSYDAENEYKKQIVDDLFVHESVVLPKHAAVIYDDNQWNYRNKMEYSFWGDDDGLHLALHVRGSHGKQIVQGSKLALPAIDAAANAIANELSKLKTRAGDLKTIIVRANQQGEAVAALFTKLDSFKKIALPKELKGLRVYHSNPQSPASVQTKLLYELGSTALTDDILGKKFMYDADSFFQVNIPIFEQALIQIKTSISLLQVPSLQKGLVDMYAGVGSIGLSVAMEQVSLIELDPATVAMAKVNAQLSGVKAEVIKAASEKALEYITGEQPVIFDPPRAGLHDKVVMRTLETKPPIVVYLSCNPATQARDLAKLQVAYTIEHFQIYNFFPRTPHIETLAILKLK